MRHTPPTATVRPAEGPRRRHEGLRRRDRPWAVRNKARPKLEIFHGVPVAGPEGLGLPLIHDGTLPFEGKCLQGLSTGLSYWSPLG